jgi:hypothetical protein
MESEEGDYLVRHGKKHSTIRDPCFFEEGEKLK